MEKYSISVNPTVVPAHYEDKFVASFYCFILGQNFYPILPLTLWNCLLESCDKVPTLLYNDCWKGFVVIYSMSEKKLLYGFLQ